MKAYSNVLIIYPVDSTIGFLSPIMETLQELFPKANTCQALSGAIDSGITPETDLVIFLGHGAPSKLFGSVDTEGEKSLFLDIQKGAELLGGKAVLVFACNSNQYLDKVRKSAKINCYVTFGDMPTDWDHVIHNRDFDPEYLKGFTELHLDFYKSTIVEALIEGFRNGYRTNSILGIARRVSLIINKKINQVILCEDWSTDQKLQMVEILFDFKQEMKYAQPL